MHLVSSHPELLPNLNQLQKAAISVLSKHKPSLIKLSADSDVNINFISDSEIQVLNKEYRQKDKPTDVLSWGFINADLLPHELAGEIYISLDTAKRDAASKKITLLAQFNFLITHGLLHVFDYDHNTDEEEEDMNQVTEEILNLISADG
jgi:probable rRNA maturation factor